jgi:hypothetical protein
MDNPKIGEAYNIINPLRTLETIYSWLAKKKIIGWKFFLTKVVHLNIRFQYATRVNQK